MNHYKFKDWDEVLSHIKSTNVIFLTGFSPEDKPERFYVRVTKGKKIELSRTDDFETIYTHTKKILYMLRY